MYLKFKVKRPLEEKVFTTKTIKGTEHVYYEYARVYDEKKKYTIPKTTAIGKVYVDNPEYMCPNMNYLTYFPDAELPEEFPASARSGCLEIGGHLVIKKVIEHYGLDEKLSTILGDNAGLFLDLAAYWIMTENNAA